MTKSEARVGHSEGIYSKLEIKMLNPKSETLNSKQTQMSKAPNSKPYDLLDLIGI